MFEYFRFISINLFILKGFTWKPVACQAQDSSKQVTMPCYVTKRIFGQALPSTEKSVVIHKVGFSRAPFESPGFEVGSDCVCDDLSCTRRLSEYCVPKNTSTDLVELTYKSFDRMNPYVNYVGVVIVIDLGGRGEETSMEQVALLTRTCYPWVAVFCSFFHSEVDSGNFSAMLFPWMRECCDAILIPSRKLVTLPDNQTLLRTENDAQQTLIFTMSPHLYACNKCGVTKPLNESDLHNPESYRKQQKRANGKVIPIAARHRDAYLHLTDTDPPEALKVNVTGGFEHLMVESLANPNMMNFTFFYMGNATYWTSGGGTLTNGTYDGMLDLISKRHAILAVSNQKPFDPAGEIFTFTECYDVDTLPFASRVETLPVTIVSLFRSFGWRSGVLLLGSSIVVSMATHILLQPPEYSFSDLLSVIWFFAMRLFQTSFTMSLVTRELVSGKVKFVVMLWSVLSVVFNSMFGGVWVTFITTPPFKGVIDRFDKMIKEITTTNSTAYMSPGLLGSASIYGEASKPIFENGFASTNAKFIVDRLLKGKRRHFWFYERIFLIYSMNRFDRNGTIHISSDYFFIQQQCWVMQKNCALEYEFSRNLNLFKECGLFNRLKRRANVLDLPPRIVETVFKPLTYSQLRESILFSLVLPPFMLTVMLFWRCVIHLARRQRVDHISNGRLNGLQTPNYLSEIQSQLERRRREGMSYARNRHWPRGFQPHSDDSTSWELLKASRLGVLILGSGNMHSAVSRRRRR